ncbi:probable WRKY transcription factor protein 1 [Lucilia cuprina]|uniref:probable WRKY transcription factor protein 1 n=1 Tax=Lucilia cuprina TaxID=7375 RepID=UPI001F06F1FB|nr:probable WRKY transcription factor protein 1 [Lucilia cuprina]XP_046801586.1 probable WRKY transcription factor protein 1 [Lucilia cuprina]XP_046801587.1 probable WRKY transcription factor protein 1 [Lucilia cuprina]XP_046801588.1 probable WRKY transcription factor protein 1 [Lucilia cuprina]XP_046801590.1 probable WRKY transcription factor protein 1 [Lucilia cuprina]XP_046801591.1 probable WRKY transcription factor protein 1 [Lucilia cuprina]
MCDINCIWLFNLLVAVVLILLQQQQHVVGSKQVQQQQQQKLQQHNYISPYDGISSYAAAAAANYLRRTSSLSSSQAHNVVKREIKHDKNTDFISYLNDFNMQDETSIPEDIIDQQHLQEIIDKQQQGLQLEQQQLQQKYVGDSAATSGSSILNGDDDIIDVNLPYDDSSTDTDSDADIILESQRSSERSDDNKNSNNNSNNNSSKNIKTNNNNHNNDEDDSEEDEEIVTEETTKKNLKKSNNNKKEMFKERKTFQSNNISNNDNKNEEKKKQQQQIKYENNIDYSNQYNIYGDVDVEKSLKDNDSLNDDDNNDADEDEEDKFELDDEDDDDGSAEYEKFKTMHEQKQREQQQQKQKEQMSTLKTIINDDETFSRPDSNEEMTNNQDNDKIKHMVDYTDDNNKNKKNLNDYEIFHQHLLEQKQQLLQKQQQQQQQQLSQHIQDAIGDIEENENPNIFKTNSYTHNNDNNNNNNNESKNKNDNNFANIFIPRKIKRHNGAARLDDATNRYTKLKQEQLLQQQQQQLKSQINTEENHPDAVAKVSSQEENFKKKYYDILKENSTSTTDHHLQQQQQKHHHHPSGESNPKDFSFYDENNERDSTHEVKKQTAFEKEKSLRRNNKRYGHKTHKKKYKDYLRYSQIMMMTTTSTPSPQTTALSTQQQTPTKNAINILKDNQDTEVTDLNYLRDKHAKKFKLEKLKSLIPPAPIFVLKPRAEKENKDDLRETEKVEEPTTKPFYEGQINYFLETPDDDSERANEVRFITKGERMDTNDWYRKLSPVLRNGNKKINPVAEERSGIGVGRSRGGYTPYHHYRPQHHGQLHHGQTRNHHYHQQHHHQQQQHARQPHHHQALKHSRHHAYQRKMIPKRLVTTTTPMPPPSRKQMMSPNGIGELGHQITDIKDLERYYAKWPHLAKVQSRLHEEQMREEQSENYPDYEYDNDDYFEENDNKDDNLPPYIRKFNRRNKQLLDLLEGTIAPPTKTSPQLRWSGSKLQPGPRDSSVGSMSVRIDDDYLKEKRKRYHQRQRQIHDLFAQQRSSTTTTQPPPYPYVNVNGDRDGGGGGGDEMAARQYTHTENHLPDEDVSISLESNEQENEFNSNSAKHESGVGVDEIANDDSKSEQEIWQKEIETKSANMAAGNLEITNWQMEKLITSTPAVTATTTKKSAIHKLPSYPSIAGGYMNRPRSRSAQFAPSSGSEFRRVPLPYLNNLNNNDNINNNNNFINAGGFVAYNKAPVVSKTINGRFSANTPNDYNNKQQQQSVSNTTTTSPDASKTQSSSSSSNNHLTSPSSPSSAASSSSVTNSFIYHRVVDASPRLVGAGFIPGRKQRLPFVAITDRRLETSKKSLTDHQKDFEQNHYPLP